MISIKALIAYLCYGVAAALFFLYVLFPEPALEAYMNSRLAAVDPSLSMQAQRMRPALPPGLKMSGVTLTGDGTPLARVDVTRVYPDLMALLKGTRQVRFQANLADGTITGRADIGSPGPGQRLRVEADLNQIRLDRIDVVQAAERFSLSGFLSGRIVHEGSAAMGLTNGALTMTELRIRLKEPFFGIRDLLMNQTDASFSVNDRNLRLDNLAFDGPLLQGQISGSVELRQPLGLSRLNLSGNAKPRPELFAQLPATLPREWVNPRTLATRGVAFRIRGSIENPDFSMR